MLKHTSDIQGSSIGASDGPIGSVIDFLFDDATWKVRWLVVDVGPILPGRKILLPPSVLGHVSHMAHQFSVRLTRQQVKESPDINIDEPVSRQNETNIHDYFGWSPYWSTGLFMVGGYGYAGGGVIPRPGAGLIPIQHEDRAAQGDPHLRSVREITGYRIQARDGDIGHIADILIEDVDWSVHYLVVDTENWWNGKNVLISPRSIERIDWSSNSMHLNVDRNKIKNSPAYDASTEVDQAYEYQYHGYYDHKAVIEPA